MRGCLCVHVCVRECGGSAGGGTTVGFMASITDISHLV